MLLCVVWWNTKQLKFKHLRHNQTHSVEEEEETALNQTAVGLLWTY